MWIVGPLVLFVGGLVLIWLALERMRRNSKPPKRQQWASRSPEKLSPAEQQFCLLVARGVKPEDALDGIVRERGVNLRAMAAKWMKKAKIQRAIAIAQDDDLKEHAAKMRCPICWQAGCNGSCQANIAPSDYPTADLTEDVGTRIKEGK